MDLLQKFDVLGRQQLAFGEGIKLMNEARLELMRAKTSASNWGNVAIFANLIIIPLNVVINSFDAKGAKGIYQTLVKLLYEKYAQSGTRSDGSVKTVLGLVKKAVLAELSAKALTEYIPGVNILIGFAEDTNTVWQVAAKVSAGSVEMNSLLADLDRRIEAATRELRNLGVLRADALDRMTTMTRTA